MSFSSGGRSIEGLFRCSLRTLLQRESGRPHAVTALVAGVLWLAHGAVLSSCGTTAPPSDECNSHADCPFGHACIDHACERVSDSNGDDPLPCEPDCSPDMECGDDGCGGSCGVCDQAPPVGVRGRRHGSNPSHPRAVQRRDMCVSLRGSSLRKRLSRRLLHRLHAELRGT